MRNKSILTKTMRRLMLMVLLVTQVVMGTSSAFADTVTGSVTFDSSVWGTTNRQFDNGSTQTWTNYLTLTLNPVTAGDNCRISGGYLGLYHQSTLEITAPVGCTITGMTIAGSNYGGTPSTTPGSLTSEPGSTSYTWTGSSSSVTISTDAGERDSYDFQSIVVTYETSLDVMASTTTNGAIYSFNQTPNPFLGASLYAKTITAGDQEMYFDAFGSDDPMIMQNLVDSSFYLHMPAQSRLRLQRSDSSSDIYITKAVFTFVSGSPSISPDGGTYNSSTHTWTGQESQIIFLFNEEADIQLIESEAGLLYSLAITSEGGGSVSYTASSGSGTVGANNSNSFMVNDGEEVMLTFTPSSDAYKVVAATVNGTNVFDALTTDGTYTIPSVTGNLTVYGGFDINESVNQRISLQEVPFRSYTGWGVDAQVVGTADCAWVLNEPTGVPYGDGSVINRADLSHFSKLRVVATEGTPRFLLNRDMDEGQWSEDENESHLIEYPKEGWSEKYFTKETTTEGDVYTVDLKQIKNDKGFVYLHAIKGANWADVTVSSMEVELDGNPQVSIAVNGEGTVGWSTPTGVGEVGISNPSELITTGFDSELNLTFTPNTGYHLLHVFVNDINDYVNQVTGNSLTLHITQDTNIRVVFEMDTNKVPLTADDFYQWDGWGPLAQIIDQGECQYVLGEPAEIPYGDPEVKNYVDLSSYSRLEVTVEEGSPRFLFNRECENGLWLNDETESHLIEYPKDGWTSRYFSQNGNVWSVDLKQMVADKGFAHLHAIKAPWDSQITVTKMELVENGDIVLPEAYAVLSEGNTVLTFYYDVNKNSHDGAMSVGPFSSGGARGWDSNASNITKVEFDKSFANCLTLTSTANWFVGCDHLTTINGTRRVKTADVTEMWGMFLGCSSLTSLDLSSFNTTKLSAMQQMFFGCSALTTVYVGSGWNLDNMSYEEAVFEGCTSLVGGYGTAYDANSIDYTYARIDEGSSNPGYFTGREPLTHEMMFVWDGVGAGSQKTALAASAYSLGKSMEMPYGEYTGSDATIYADLSSYSRIEVLVTAGSPRFLFNRDETDGQPSENEAESHMIDSGHEGCMTWASKYFTFKPTEGGTLWFVNLKQMVEDKGFAHLHAIKGANDANITVTKMDLVVAQNVAIEPEAYAVLSEENTKLTFYYDNQKESRGGMGVGPFAGASERGWDSQSFTITSVVFDSSFANDTTLTSTAWWFYNCHGLTTISGISYLNTANVTDMIYMFHGCFGLTSLDVSHFNTANVTNMHSMFMNCSGLTTLDLSSFNTANVTDMRQLFSGCSNLTTIYAGNGWNTEKIIDGSEMFAGCTVLVGGAGTTFDTDHTDASYAHIDGGESSPGYFTAAGEEPFQESKNWSVVGTLAGSSESGVTMIAIDETNYTATFTLLPAGVYEYKVRDDNNIDRTYGQPDGSDVTVTVPEDNYSVTILFNAKTKAVSHELAEPIYSVIGFTSADGSGRSEFVMQRDSVGVPYTVSTSVSMGTRTFKISINHEDSVYYGKKGQLKGEPIAFYTPMAGMNVTFYFDPVTKLATTSVGIIKDKYAVHVSVAGNGSVVATETDDTGTEQSSTIVNGTSEEDVEVTEDNTLTLTLQPADGNHLVSLIVDGVDVTSQIEDNKYMLPAIAETHTVSVTYVQNDLEPYAALSDDNTVLTFYYDNLKEARNGMSVGPFNSSAERGWHEQRENITKVVFDNSFADCDTLTSTASWFAECGNLATIEDLNLLKTANVKGMHGMFYGCSSLTSIDLSNFNTANVTNMHGMFAGCSSLTSLDLHNFDVSNVEDMQGMFGTCSNLTSLDLSGFNTANVKIVANMFMNCSNLMSLDISSFDVSNVLYPDYMFSGCTSLTSLDLSSFNTANAKSMNEMFSACSALKTIYVGSGWSTAEVVSAVNMFNGCTSLVGGNGTAFDAEHTDATYAHIDGGPSNPGYLTLALSMGDANGDGSINIADAVATVTNILGQPTEENFYKYAADMNGDSVIDIFDVTLIVNAALNAPAPGRRGVTRSGTDEVPAEAIQLMADAHNVYMDIDQAQQYTALQFDMDLPEGTELLDVRLSGNTDHQLSFVKRGDSQYRVIALSMNNEVFRSAHGHLIQLQVSNNIGENNVKMSDVLFVKPSGKTVTGISEHLNATMAADDSIYDLNGRYVGNDRRQLSKGIYIINHKKVNIK